MFMMQDYPFVSVVVPIRNEEKYIQQTLQAILEQDYPLDKLEVLVADGMSTDGTRPLVLSFSNLYPHVRLIDNTGRIVPTGLNLSIAQAKGQIIVRMDSHSVYPSHYIRTLVEALDTYKCHNVGCLIETKPANSSVTAQAIAIALSHPFGVGNAYFRIGSNVVKEVDTVPFGCFRREVFSQIGMFDEELVRNQDDEFNARMRKNGLKIVLLPSMTVSYYARPTLGRLFKMYFQYGLFKPLVNLKLKQIATVRQLVPAALVGYLMGTLVLGFIQPLFWLLFVLGLAVYAGGLLFASLKAKPKSASLAIVTALITAFAVLHFSYGWGYLQGLVGLLFRQRLANVANGTSR
jgi:glycosyltransferase involved in cell wall biosynthesis